MRSRTILLATIVPFAALCALGLWWLSARRAEPVTAAPAPRVEAEPTPPGEPPAAPRASPPARPEPEEPAAPSPAAPPPSWSEQPELTSRQQADREAALARLAPLVQQCIDEEGDRSLGPVELEVSFVLTRRGEQGVAERPGVGGGAQYQPMLAACIEDTLKDTELPEPGSSAPFEVRASRRFVPIR